MLKLTLAIAMMMASCALPSRAGELDTREGQVAQLIERYFTSWSAKDMDRYGACFVPQAVVQMISPTGKLSSQGLQPFLRSQQLAHQQSKERLIETPETVDITLEAGLARVVVYWKLVNGDTTQYGYDHFTLMPYEGQWRIANLIFYSEPESAK